VDSLGARALEDYMGSDDRREVLGLADSGSDDTKIEKAIAKKGWTFLIALGATRSVKSEALSLPPPLRRGATWPRFFVVIAGARGTPGVWRRLGTNVSEWTFASDTPRALCAPWARSSGCVPHGAIDRRVAARSLPAMI
jgi:hypothetical protein